MSKPPREYLYVIDVAKECFDVAEGDLNRAATLFRQIMPDADEDFQQATLEYLSRLARKKIRLSVRYRSHLDFDQPALRTKLRAHVVEILREHNPDPETFETYEGKIELAGVVHSFCLVLAGSVVDNGIGLWVLVGSYDDDDLDAEISAIGLGETRAYLDEIDQISPD
jgi:hypothetical protein